MFLSLATDVIFWSLLPTCGLWVGPENVKFHVLLRASFRKLQSTHNCSNNLKEKNICMFFFFLFKSIMISFILWLPTFLLLSFENIGVVLTTFSFHWRCLDQVVFALSQKKRRKIFLLQGIDQLEMNFISDPSFRVDFTTDGKPKLKSFFGAVYGLKLSRQ